VIFLDGCYIDFAKYLSPEADAPHMELALENMSI
jgi:hypothetical protein